MHVCVVGGAGYVGLITGLGLAEIGHRVVNVDVDRSRIEKLQAHTSPVDEEGIQEALAHAQACGNLSFDTELGAAAEASDVVIMAVGTPSAGDGSADVSQLSEVVHELGRHLGSYTVLAIKSTAPMGTLPLVRDILGQGAVEGEQFDVVINPEFLREGKGLHDFFYPERIVIGTASQRARRTMRELYAPLMDPARTWPVEPERPRRPGGPPLLETDAISAQMIKYASNAFLATRISFINEIASLCEQVGADVDEVAAGMGCDPRIGAGYLSAGIGFGGPCLEKDLAALIHFAGDSGDEPELLRAVLQRNDKQVASVLAKITGLLKSPLAGRTVAVWGLAFKAGTNDVRNSLALRVIDRLREQGLVIRAHDPVAMEDARSVRPDLDYSSDPVSAAEGADVLAVLTDWPQYKEADFRAVQKAMASPAVVDARNLLDVHAMRKLGFTYVGMGRA